MDTNKHELERNVLCVCVRGPDGVPGAFRTAYNREQVFDARRLVALLCLAVVLYAALTPGASGLCLAIFVPVWFFAAAIVTFSIRREATDRAPGPLPFLPVLASRAPPIA